MHFALLLLLVTALPHFSLPAIVGECDRRRKSNRCTGSNAFWQFDGICIEDSDGIKLPTCHIPELRKFHFKLVASVVQLNISSALPVDKLWIRGSGPGLSWEESMEMTLVRDGYWVHSVRYEYDSNALLCMKETRCTLNQRAVEFRVHRDQHGLDDMLGPNIYVPLPVSNSISGHSKFKPPYVFTHPWFDGMRVLAKEYTFRNLQTFEPYFSSYINFTAYYPPSYQHNTLKRYPVVIVLGSSSNNFLVPLLESMYVHEASVEEAFVFAIHNPYNAPFCEFNPFVVLDIKPDLYGGNTRYGCFDAHNCRICSADVNSECITCASRNKTKVANCVTCMNCFDDERVEFCDSKEFEQQAERCGFRPLHCHARGDAVLDNIEHLLLPEMSVRTMGRIMADYPRERISIVGIDGGGLLACHAAFSRPFVYKNAGCMSAPFHWPIRYLDRQESRQEQGIGMLFRELEDKMGVSPEMKLMYASQRYYIDVGEFDDVFMPVVDHYNYSDWVVEQMMSRLHVQESNILYYRNVLGGHNSPFHLHRDGDHRMLDRIRIPLTVFLKPEGGTSAIHPRTPLLRSKDYVKRSEGLFDSGKGPKFTLPTSEDVSGRSCKDFLPKESKTVSVNIYLLSIGKLRFTSYE